MLLDDREAGAGEKLTDAELLGCPLRLVAGKRGLAEGKVETQVRRTGRRRPARARRSGSASRRALAGRLRLGWPASAAPQAAAERPAAVRTRSLRPAAAADRRGAPLRPWTLPNLVGYLRLAAIPVFLVSRSTRATVARPPRRALPLHHARRLPRRLPRPRHRPVQPPRRAAGPVVDRLSALAGAAVCWHFELLPRWALAVLVVRELATVRSRGLALRRGLDLEISWVGRFATFASSAGSSGRWSSTAGSPSRSSSSASRWGSRDDPLRRARCAALGGPQASSSVTRHAARALPNVQALLDGRASRRIIAPRGQGDLDDTFPDVGSMSDEELKELIDELTDEEREISYKRRAAARQDRHPAGGAGQPPARQARGRRRPDHRR